MAFAVRVMVTVLLCCSSLSALAQDYAREKRWADEVVPGVVVGEPVWLELKNGHKFLNLYAAASTLKPAIVLVHGVGVHPDHGLIGILRGKLHELGYATLSVQMPVARGEGATVDDYYPALFPQAGERVTAAARFLQEKGYRDIVLISHSMGAWMLNVYLLEKNTPSFAAWVVLGLTGRFWGASAISIPWLGIEWGQGRLRLPILDVYGENDIKPTLEGARARAGALAHIEGSAQIMIPGADHHYTGKEDELVRAIQRFIAKTVQ
jgi:pimeloyl-ACP methyl ester carboxylesterase